MNSYDTFQQPANPVSPANSVPPVPPVNPVNSVPPVRKSPFIHHYSDGTASALRKKNNFRSLRFYQRSEVLYHLTYIFCKRYLPKYGDRTVDQMIQAARSTKQNIVEGMSDGQTSMETELKLLGIARGSNQELLEDYIDHMKRNAIEEWYGNNPRFEKLHKFCSIHSKYEDYKDWMEKMDEEEMANMALCLCHQVDTALNKFIENKDKEFTTEGGIKERMTAARLEQRNSQKDIIRKQSETIKRLESQIEELKSEIKMLKDSTSR